MATGDISAPRLRPDGLLELTIEGFTSGVTAALGYRARVRGALTGTAPSAGDTFTQGGTSATAKYVSSGTDSGGAYVIFESGTGIPNYTTAWTSGGATFTPANMAPSYTIPGPNTPYLTRVSLDYEGVTAGTCSKNIPLNALVRLPKHSYSIAGTFTSGAFVDGETITQTTTGAVGKIVGDQAAGTVLIAKSVGSTTASPVDDTNTWVGGTSSAVFTPSAVPSALAFPTKDQKVRGGNAVVLCVPFEYCWAKDDTGGGNSGTAPTLTAFAGNFVNSGGAAQTSNAVTALTVTNDCTLAYPTGILQWDAGGGSCVCMADRVDSDFDISVQVFLPALPLSYAQRSPGTVRFDIDGATSLVNWNTTVSALTATKRSQSGSTGYWMATFKARVPASTRGFTNGELLNCRARFYPFIGDTVIDTNDYTTADDEPYGRNKMVLVWNSTPKYAYVDLVGGNNANTGSTTKATAISNPIQHIGKAIQNDCTIIMLKSGQNHPGVGTVSSSRRTTNEWYRLVPEDGHDWTDTFVVLDNTVQQYKCQRLMAEGIQMNLALNNGHWDGEDADNFLRFKNCLFNSGAFTAARPPHYNSNLGYYHSCWGDLGIEWALAGTASIRTAMHADGCFFTNSSNAYIKACFRAVCNDLSGNIGINEPLSTNPIGIWENVIICNNNFRNLAGSGQNAIEIGLTENSTLGFAVVGNSFERVSNGSPTLHIHADTNVTNCNNVLIADNTNSGERCSIGYNDQGSVQNQSLNWVCANTLTEVEASKNDDFPVSITTLTRSGTTATATISAHGYSTGDVLVISGVTQAAYNGTFVITVTGANTFTYVMASDPGASGTGNPIMIVAGHGNRIGGFPVTYGKQRHSWYSGQVTGLTAAGSFLREFPGQNSWELPFNENASRSSTPSNGTLPITGFFRYVGRRTAIGGTPGIGGSDLRLTPESPAWDEYSPKYIFTEVDLMGWPWQNLGPRGAWTSRRLPFKSAGTTTIKTGVTTTFRP